MYRKLLSGGSSRKTNRLIVVGCIMALHIFVSACNAQTSRQGNVIVKSDVSFNKEQQNAINNVKSLIKKTLISGASDDFTIILKLERAKEKNKEQVTIRKVDDNTIQIESPTSQGLVFGAYTWMEHLGFRFYGPGLEWTYIPSELKYKMLATNLSATPNLSLRYFFSGRAFDKKHLQLEPIESEWNVWQQQLRLGNPNHMSFGHYGTKFNKKYKKQIIAHPEWRALIKGKRQDWSGKLKLCYSNHEVQNLYIQDALSRLRQMKAEKQSPPYYINMEPPDGKNFCQCDKCQRAQNLSDNIFNLANIVARALKKVDTDARVFLLGYNTHALPPSFPLENNVYVVIAPDFSVYPPTSPEEVIAAWIRAHPGHLFYRGYLALPMWNHDLPLDVKSAKHFQDIFQLIIKKGFLGFNFETTFSYGAVGWLQYTLAHLAWDKSFDPVETRNEFYEKMFPGHVDSIDKVYKLLQNSGTSSIYLPAAQSILMRILNDRQIDSLYRKRIVALFQYVKYIKLYQDWGEKSNEAAKTALIEQTGKMFQTKMVNTLAIYKSLRNKHKIPTAKLSLKENLDEEEELKPMMAIAASPTPVGANRARASVAPLNPTWRGASTLSVEDAVTFRNDIDAIVFASDDGQAIPIKAKSRILPQYKNGWGRIEVRSVEGDLIKSIPLKQANQWRDYSFIAPKRGLYQIAIKQAATEVKLVPPNVPFAFETAFKNMSRNKTKQLFYFYVPTQAKNIYIKALFASGKMNIVSPTGKVTVITVPTGGQKTVKVETHGEEGVWRIESNKSGFELVNIPHLISLNKNAVLK